MPIDPTHSASEYTTYIRQKADIVRNGALNFAGGLFRSAAFTSDAGKQQPPPPPPPPSEDYGILTGFSATKSLYYPALNPGTSDFTVECFFRSPVINGRYLWYFSGDTHIRLTNDGLTARIDDGGDYVISSPAIDTWYHVAMTRSGNNWYAMFNGVNSLFETQEFSLSSRSLIVGSYSLDDDGSDSFRGSISNFRYTKRALYNEEKVYTIPSAPLQAIADTELLLLAQPGAPLADSSGNGYVAEGTCDVIPGPISPFPVLFQDYGILTGFSATKNLFYPGLNPGTSDFTVEFFSKIQVGNAGYVFYFDDNAGEYFAMYIESAGYITIETSPASTYDTSVSYPDYWVHVAATCYQGNIYLAFDGTNSLVGTTSSDLSQASLCVGNYQPGTIYQFTGSISNFRYVESALYTTVGSYTIPSLPLQNIADTELLLLAKPGASFADSSTTPKTATGTCDFLPGPISV